MIKIGICDDEVIILEILTRLLKECAEKNNWEIEIYPFQEGMELVKKANALDMVFLDIDMPRIDGIETGKRIMENNHTCKIIMATGRVDRFKESFYINAFRFVTKPFDEKEITEAVVAVMKQRLGNKTIKLYQNRVSYDVEQRDILYVTAFDGYVEFTVLGKKEKSIFRRDETLTEVEQCVSEKIFYRTDRKYLVNMWHIVSYSKGKVEMRDGQTIHVSRRRKKEFEEKLIDFDLKCR